ncbi:hypothetical protein NDU88_004396 [Pleurodeles waltl]|uniref:F-box domain-containing protein n=1 Tax=Pleurodeles waltl TaxID=8319 RepID=A0AAV7W554_PLEWA|nr:hypothetical protein NDU88_004396 [Pleurodeles waltl]
MPPLLREVILECLLPINAVVNVHSLDVLLCLKVSCCWSDPISNAYELRQRVICEALRNCLQAADLILQSGVFAALPGRRSFDCSLKAGGESSKAERPLRVVRFLPP